jgi:hypothetical protein
MKRSFAFLISLTLGVLGVASGCSSDEGGEAKASVDRESLPKKVAEAFCESVAECCTEAGIEQDMDTCLENAEESFDDSLAPYEALEVKYDGTRADACVAAIKSQTAQCGDLTEADSKELANACGALYVGTLSAGEACTASVECAGKLSTCKREEPNDESGKCAPLEKRAHAKSGDDCATTCSEASCTYDPADNDEVTAGCYVSDKLWCNDGTCQALGDVGDECDVVGCKAGLFCADGACAPQRKETQPCSLEVIGACEEDTFCNDEGECEALHAAGVACGMDSECESGTCRGGVCAINNASENSCSGVTLN